MFFHEWTNTKLLCLINYCQLHSSTSLLGSPAASPTDFLQLLHTHLTGLQDSNLTCHLSQEKHTQGCVSW